MKAKSLKGKFSFTKKILLIFCLSLLSCCSLFLFSACGSSNPTEQTTETEESEVGTEGLVYFYDDETLTATVTGYIGNDTDVVIPKLSNNYTVTTINDYAFYACTGLKSIKISDTVTHIGYAAFQFCVSLNSVTIGEGVTSIEEYAFYNCTMLTQINYNAINVNDLSLNNNIFYCAGLSGNGISIVVGANVKSIPEYLFCPYNTFTQPAHTYSPKIISIEFKENSICSKIGNYAFAYCLSLERIVLPESLISIGDYAFRSCSALESLIIPSSVTSIGSYAFYFGIRLLTIIIPENVTYIGDCAFYCCHRLIEVINLSNLSIYAGESSNGNVAYYAKIVKTYGASSIVSNDGLKIITIDGNNYIVNYAGIKTELDLSLYLSVNKEYLINDYAFYSSSLISITIPNNITSIGNYAFKQSTSLESITISESVARIGIGAFEDCSNLISAIFKNTENWNIDSTPILSDDLADTSTAATYLRSTYCSYTWTRGETEETD